MNQNFYKKLFNKILNETLEEKADNLAKTLKLNKDSEFDYVEEIDEPIRPKKYSRDLNSRARKSAEKDMSRHFKKSGNPWTTDVEPSEKWPKYKLPYDTEFNFDEISEGRQSCNECGLGEMIEGECNECGYKKMSMKESKRKKQTCNECGLGEMIEGECNECGYMKEETKESKKLSKGQEYIAKQAEPKDKIGANDFKKLRAKKTETKEGSKPDFLDLDNDGDKKEPMKSAARQTKKSKVNETVYRLFSGNESATFTENEVIDIIESLVNEEKDNIKKGQIPAGYTAYEKAVKGSKKENDAYINSVLKKLKEYVKPGSKGEFKMKDVNIFPKGNGELAKMDKKAYEVSKDGEDFIDDFLRPGMQTLDYDEMHPNEDWMDDIIQGSSRTGNNPEWGNAEQTEVNKKLNKTRKTGKYNRLKRQAYNKAPQPVVSDKPGQENGKGLNLKLESTEDKKLNEEFNRIQQLMGYQQKTQ
jgi:hypothetical protein